MLNKHYIIQCLQHHQPIHENQGILKLQTTALVTHKLIYHSQDMSNITSLTLGFCLVVQSHELSDDAINQWTENDIN